MNKAQKKSLMQKQPQQQQQQQPQQQQQSPEQQQQLPLQSPEMAPEPVEKKQCLDNLTPVTNSGPTFEEILPADAANNGLLQLAQAAVNKGEVLISIAS